MFQWYQILFIKIIHSPCCALHAAYHRIKYKNVFYQSYQYTKPHDLVKDKYFYPINRNVDEPRTIYKGRTKENKLTF